MPVSVIKGWVEQKRMIGELNMAEVDELPDTGNVYGHYFKTYNTGIHDC